VVDKIYTPSAANEFVRDFENRTINHVWRGAGTAIFLEIGSLDLDSRRNPKGELTISVEWSWRIEGPNNILLGSFNEDEEIYKAIDILKGRKILTIEFFGRLKEIQLELEGEIWFSSFATVEGSPEWAACNNKNEWLYYRKGKYVIEKST